MSGLRVLVLAAGQGTRMKSQTPKVLHPVGGRALILRVLDTVRALSPAAAAVVVGVGRESVLPAIREAFGSRFTFIVQRQQRGSGHAVRMASPWLRRQRGTLLVVYGDTPLLTSETLRRLVFRHTRSAHAATFLAMETANPAGYGRMVADASGAVERIVEDRDATEEEKNIRIVNSGVACWDIAKLLDALPRLKPDNAKREYYLTDAAALLRAAGGRVGMLVTANPEETHGVNTRVDLATVESLWRRRILERWMRAGVTMMDPATTYIEDRVRLAPDVILHPGTVLRGRTRIASGAEIGPFTVLEDAVVAEKAKIGPFARLRPGSRVGAGARIGNFVEIKNAQVGRSAKINHLTYVGDARVGDAANLGAGTITCNYDGFRKFKTRIGAGAFVGSNTNLVAPVTVGEGAIIAAGSTITEAVPPGALGVARARQTNKKGWAYEFRKREKR